MGFRPTAWESEARRHQNEPKLVTVFEHALDAPSRVVKLDLAIDEQARTVTLKGRPGSPELRFRYEGDAGQPLRFLGDQQSIQEITLRPLPEAILFRVLR